MSSETPPKRGRGRPRRVESDSGILEGARDLLRERRYAELTLDEIGRQAGVAKTTIYRRWPSKAALVAELLRTEIAPPEGDVAEVAGGIARFLRSESGELLAGLIGEAQANRDTALIVRSLLEPYRLRLASLAGERRGELLLAALLLPLVVDGRKPDAGDVSSVLALLDLK